MRTREAVLKPKQEQTLENEPLRRVIGLSLCPQNHNLWLTEISRWAKQHLQPSSPVISDGLPCFSAVTEAGYTHVSIVTGGGPQNVAK
jgi:hypothetical protein